MRKTSLEEILQRGVEREISAGQQDSKGQKRLVARALFFFFFFFFF